MKTSDTHNYDEVYVPVSVEQFDDHRHGSVPSQSGVTENPSALNSSSIHYLLQNRIASVTTDLVKDKRNYNALQKFSNTQKLLCITHFHSSQSL